MTLTTWYLWKMDFLPPKSHTVEKKMNKDNQESYLAMAKTLVGTTESNHPAELLNMAYEMISKILPLVEELSEGDPCDNDIHGYCQEHSSGYVQIDDRLGGDIDLCLNDYATKIMTKAKKA